MADSKVTGLGTNTAPAPTDLLHLIDDPGGTPSNQKIAVSDLVYESGDVRRQGTVGDGVTNDRAAIQAAYDALPTRGILEFVPSETYYIGSTTGLLFDENKHVRFNGCQITYDGTGDPLTIGDASAGIFETWFEGHVRILRTASISHDGTQTATSQLKGNGIKFINMLSMVWRGSAYVNGFNTGYLFEGNGVGMSISQFYGLQTQDCLVDFRLENDSSAGSFITALDFYGCMATWNPTFYTSQVGSKCVETVKNGRTLDGCHWFGGTLEVNKEYRIWNDASWMNWQHVYWDLSGTLEIFDIHMTANSNNCTVENGAGQRLLTVEDLGSLNSFPNPHRRQVNHAGDVHYSFNGTAENAQKVRRIHISLTDDSFFDLPDASEGFVIGSCGAEAGMWGVQADGTCTKISGSANTADDGTDTNFSVYNVSGNKARVINRLGSTKKCSFTYHYNDD